MNANINEIELKLLTYLHENAEGFGERHQLNPTRIKEQLGIDENVLRQCGTYLEEHGLIGLQTADITNHDSPDGLPEYMLNGIYLTGLGEDYMRELEKQPSIARKMTMATLKELGKIAQDVAVKVLTAHLTGHP